MNWWEVDCQTSNISKPLGFAAGQNVIAIIGGKEVGPIYCVQIADRVTTIEAWNMV